MRIPVYVLALAPLLAACHEPCDTVADATAPPASSASCSTAGAATQRYIVVLRDDVGEPRDVAIGMARSQGTSADFIYTSSIKGFAARLSPRSVDALRRDARVMMVEPVKVVTLTETEFRPPSWGLDRIDQRDLPLDSSYTYPRTGAGVHFYGIDSGILSTHTEFVGRTEPGFTAIDDGNGTTDCFGHGTLTASISAGTVFGVAKRMTIVPVRVFDCAGVGTTAELIAGVDWVTAKRVLPAVANMSLGVPGGDAATDSAVARSARTGIAYVVAAGNTNSDACLLSPASVPSAITVGATDLADYRASFSNYGTCLDLFAPGQGIAAAWIGSTTATAIASGTSTAAPHVAGVAGLYLEAYPSATPAAVATVLASNATADKIVNPGPGSPNLVLYAGFVPAGTTAHVDSQPTQPPTPDMTAGIAELPRVYLKTAVSNTPSNGRTIRVPAGDASGLQAALDTSASGDNILLAAGARFVGNFTVRPKSSGSGWLTITTDGCATMPAEGVRVDRAAAECYAKLVTPNVSPPLSTSGAVRNLRVIGVEMTNDAAVSTVHALVQLGDAGSSQNTLVSVPSGIILDRVYVHGTGRVDDRRCVTLNVANGAVIDSRIEHCQSAFDSQAVTLTNGPGPFKIVNNYLDAAAENVAIGGANVWIPAMPSDFEIRRNHFRKDPAYLHVRQTKNLIEFKVGQRVLIDGNVFENAYVDAQAGFAFVLWGANAGCPRCLASDFTITNNLLRNVAGGWSLISRYDATSGAGLRRVTIRNNLVIGLDQGSGNGRVFSLNDTIPDVIIEHNTGIGQPYGGVVVGASNGRPVKYRQVIRNNVFGGAYFSGFGFGSVAWSLFADASSVNTNNVYEAQSEWLNPMPGNWYPQTFDAIGLAGGAFAATNVHASPQDLALSASSPYKGKGTDGTDLGIDLASLLAAIQGVAP